MFTWCKIASFETCLIVEKTDIYIYFFTAKSTGNDIMDSTKALAMKRPLFNDCLAFWIGVKLTLLPNISYFSGV